MDYVSPATVIAVIKGNAYGHGLHFTRRVFRDAGIKILATYDIVEASELRTSGDQGRLLSLTPPVNKHEALCLLEHDIEVTINDYKCLELIYEASGVTGKKTKIHIEIDTGMGRNGILPNDFPSYFSSLNMEYVIFSGIFTHIKNAKSKISTVTQNDQFLAVLPSLQSEILINVSNSSSLKYGNYLFYNSVRVGLALYGLSLQQIGQLNLQPALTWYAQITQIYERKKNFTVGYGDGHVLKRDSILGIIPVGFVHGYPRNSKGPVLVNGTRCPIMGIINMQCMVVDLTDVLSCKTGDQAIIFGIDESGNVLGIDEVCNDLTIPNLFTCCLSESIPRTIKYVRNK